MSSSPRPERPRGALWAAFGVVAGHPAGEVVGVLGGSWGALWAAFGVEAGHADGEVIGGVLGHPGGGGGRATKRSVTSA